MGTLADDGEGAEDETSALLSRRRALSETRAVLVKASAAWAPFGCAASGGCCQLSVTRRPPWLWPSEWWLLLEALALAGRRLPPERPDGGCPFLDASGVRCSVYEARPAGCRTFFCARVTGPSRLPATQTNALLERLGALNLRVTADAAPRSLPDWHQGSASAGDR